MLETLQSFWDSSRGLQGPAGTAIRIVGILVVAWIVLRIVDRALKALKARMAAHIDDAEAAKRALTLGRIFHYIATVVVSLIAVILVLSELGISIAPILGAAGVVGLAVGFGAQSLVKDFFTGFVLLLENQIRQGDVVEIAGRTGVVEKITLRFVQLRDYGGIAYFLPDGERTAVVTLSRGVARRAVAARVGSGAVA
ncbi:MAG TPA: mechanosensitive ion channel, partial [Rubrivivax sp.]|nr:mechanosensitive ion channel [Rubrivivax sp.]